MHIGAGLYLSLSLSHTALLELSSLLDLTRALLARDLSDEEGDGAGATGMRGMSLSGVLHGEANERCSECAVACGRVAECSDEYVLLNGGNAAGRCVSSPYAILAPVALGL